MGEIPTDPKMAAMGAGLAFSVPFLIHEIAERGGPSLADLRWCQSVGDRLASGADALMFPASCDTRAERQKVSALSADMQRAVAMMAFMPGGIRLFGNHWDAGMPDIQGKVRPPVGILPATVPLLAPIIAQRQVELKAETPRYNRQEFERQLRAETCPFSQGYLRRVRITRKSRGRRQ